nr:uncharacterized mitochondrial protein AtMg00810-like [Tanacetum cinerariifolium]
MEIPLELTSNKLMARPTEKHLHAVKRIFQYLRGIANRELWYLKDSSIALTAFSDANLAGYQDTCNSTSAITALDSTIFQCTVIAKASLPYAATMSNIPGRSILTSDITLSRSMLRTVD